MADPFKTVWKYNIIDATLTLELPKGASPLRIAYQGQDLCIWFCVIPGEVKETRTFQLFGTGQPIPLAAKYVGSFSQPPLEWHLWDVTK